MVRRNVVIAHTISPVTISAVVFTGLMCVIGYRLEPSTDST